GRQHEDDPADAESAGEDPAGAGGDDRRRQLRRWGGYGPGDRLARVPRHQNRSERRRSRRCRDAGGPHHHRDPGRDGQGERSCRGADERPDRGHENPGSDL
ncbi:MAG: Nucleoid-associated protein YaaK, partial [uncultured Thermomicrobiales bacterium]